MKLLQRTFPQVQLVSTALWITLTWTNENLLYTDTRQSKQKCCKNYASQSRCGHIILLFSGAIRNTLTLTPHFSIFFTFNNTSSLYFFPAFSLFFAHVPSGVKSSHPTVSFITVSHHIVPAGPAAFIAFTTQTR